MLRDDSVLFKEFTYFNETDYFFKWDLLIDMSDTSGQNMIVLLLCVWLSQLLTVELTVLSTTPSPCVNSTCAVGASDCHVHTDGSQYCVCYAGYRCNCLSGWQGVHCNVRDPSQPVECITGWKGQNCTDDVDECKELPSNPCHNHGLCINNPGGYKCSCSPGWTGQNCTQDVDECHSGPCQHGGHCSNTPGSFRCMCTSVWSGFVCTNHPCSSSPCNNGGRCTDNDNISYSCDCTALWAGPNCNINTTCEYNPCKHTATCTNITGNVRCACTGVWKGSLCDDNSTISRYKDSPDVGMIVGLTIGSVVFMVGVIGGGFLVWRLTLKSRIDPDVDNTITRVQNQLVSSTGNVAQETEVAAETRAEILNDGHGYCSKSDGKQITDSGIVMKARLSILRSIKQFNK